MLCKHVLEHEGLTFVFCDDRTSDCAASHCSARMLLLIASSRWTNPGFPFRSQGAKRIRCRFQAASDGGEENHSLDKVTGSGKDLSKKVSGEVEPKNIEECLTDCCQINMYRCHPSLRAHRSADALSLMWRVRHVQACPCGRKLLSFRCV